MGITSLVEETRRSGAPEVRVVGSAIGARQFDRDWRQGCRLPLSICPLGSVGGGCFDSEELLRRSLHRSAVDRAEARDEASSFGVDWSGLLEESGRVR